jgi:hypothetical protein
VSSSAPFCLVTRYCLNALYLDLSSFCFHSSVGSLFVITTHYTHHGRYWTLGVRLHLDWSRFWLDKLLDMLSVPYREYCLFSGLCLDILAATM